MTTGTTKVVPDISGSTSNRNCFCTKEKVPLF